MKQLNKEGDIYIIKEIKEKEKAKEIEIERFLLNKNDLLGKLNKRFNINLTSLDSQYLSYKFFSDNSFLLIGLSSVKLYPNIIENNKNVIASKISFNYEKQCKLKAYQINKNKYLIINGKTIILLEKNEKLLISKTYNKLNNIQVISIINTEEEKDKYSGFLIRIQCLVSYENNNNKDIKGNIIIQNLILPQFENDIIIDFRLIYFNLDENRLYKIYDKKVFIYFNKKKILFYNINKENKKINLLDGFENEKVDYIKIIDNYLFVFYNNIKINIYIIKIVNEIEINFIKAINYNKKNKIILKRKVFYNKKENNIYIYYIDFLSEQFFFFFNLTNKENENITEVQMKTDNIYYFPNNCIKKKINKTFIYYINNNHSAIFGTCFYKKIIINYKIFIKEIKLGKNTIINNCNDTELNKAYILLLTNYNEIEIYNFDLLNKKINRLLYIINFGLDYNNLIDFIMINKNYLLLLNINSENNILELNKINLNKVENELNSKKDCLLECKMAYNNLYYWEDLNLLFINSDYGEISVYNIDSKANIEFINSFNYGYSSSEIIKIKNVLKKEDFSKLFIYDLLSKRLKTFKLIDIHHVYKYKENELFYFHLIIFLYNECFILFIIMENKYTLVNKVLFGKQIKIEKNLINNIKAPFSFILENLSYDLESLSFDFTLPQK